MAEPELRDVLAACLIDEDGLHAGTINLEWALGVLAAGRDAEHLGDCTQVATACVRCACDEALRGADAILAALKLRGSNAGYG